MIPPVCDLCGGPLDDGRPWQSGIDGTGAHLECLDHLYDDEEERDGDD